MGRWARVAQCHHRLFGIQLRTRVAEPGIFGFCHPVTTAGVPALSPAMLSYLLVRGQGHQSLS